jgi:hypothetical protein
MLGAVFLVAAISAVDYVIRWLWSLLVRAFYYIWGLLGPEQQMRIIDVVASLYDYRARAELAFLYWTTVVIDPTGSARKPINFRARRRQGELFLLRSPDVRQLRLLSYFWKREDDHSYQRLRELAARVGLDNIMVTGALRFNGNDAPVFFKVRIVPGAQTLELTHVASGGAQKSEDRWCSHTSPPPTNSAAILTVLRPLIGRSRCARAAP